MNPVLFTVYDTTTAQHNLSRAAFESILSQNIPVKVYVIDNGSTYPETRKWLKHIRNPKVRLCLVPQNQSPLKLANYYLHRLFKIYETVLAVPNDVVLPPNLYEEMLKCPRGVVSAFMTADKDFPRDMQAKVVGEEAHLAVCMLRDWAHSALYQRDGYFFDPGYFMYASDCDLKLRFAAMGIRGAQLDILCWHFGSASHRLAASANGAYGADEDRAYFTRKWGFAIGSEEYNRVVGNLDFRAIPVARSEQTV